MPKELKTNPTSPPVKWSVLNIYEANVTSQEPHIKNCINETIFNRVIVLIIIYLPHSILRKHVYIQCTFGMANKNIDSTTEHFPLRHFLVLINVLGIKQE